MSATSYVLSLPSLIGYFKCDEGSGTTFADYISNLSPATTAGAFDPDVKALTLNTEKIKNLYFGADGELVFNSTVALGTTFTHAFLYNGDFTNDTVLARLDATHYLAVVGRKLEINMGGSTSTSPAVAVTDHRTHLIELTANAGAALLFVDGVQVHSFSLIGNWDVAYMGTGVPFSTFSDNLATFGEIIFTTAYTDSANSLKLYNNVMVDADTIATFIDHTNLLASQVNCRFDSTGTSPKDYGMNADIIAGNHYATSIVASINKGDPDTTKSLLYELLLQSYTNLDITESTYCRGISIWFKNSDTSEITLGLMTAYNDNLVDYLTIDGGTFFPTIKTPLGHILPGTPIVDNDIHNIMLIQDDVNLTVYVDGVQDTQTAGNYIPNTFDNAALGCTFDVDTSAYLNFNNIIIGDFALFNTIPTQAEITAYVTSGPRLDAVEVITESIAINFFRLTQGIIEENFNVPGDVLTSGVFNNVVHEIIDFVGEISRVQQLLISENINMPITDIPVGIVNVLKHVFEVLGVDDQLVNNINAIEIVISALVINDLIYSDGELVLDGFVTTDDITTLYLATVNQIESVLFDTAITGVNYITIVTSDNVNITDELTPQQILTELLTDGFSFIGGLSLGEDGQFLSYAINTMTGGISEYSDFGFNSMSENLAATEYGIYELTGSDDDGNPIDALFKTGLMDFGSVIQKQNPYMYLGISTDGEILLKVTDINRDHGKKREMWYAVTKVRAASSNIRMALGRGKKARYWQYELTNVNGSNFEIESMEPLIMKLKRRV